MKLLAALPMLLLPFFAVGQSYIEYQQVFNRIDEDVLAENYGPAIERLDSVYAAYGFVYARHCIKALQICCKAEDSANADKWLAKCFVQGVLLWVVRTNDLTRKALRYAHTQQTLLKYDSLYAVYKSRTDTDLSKTIDSLLAIDQHLTDRVNNGFFIVRHTVHYRRWKANNARQFKILDSIIGTRGFPGEKLVGLPLYWEDSATAAENLVFYGSNLFDQRAFVMLLHCYSSPRKDINDKLRPSLADGCLPPSQFGALNDFMARWGKGRFGQYAYYNVWHHDPNPQNTDSINARRHPIGLNTFAQQERNKLLMRERRKSRSANSEIVLE